MPELKPGETEEEWMTRCVPDLVAEGREQDQAVAICLSRFEKELDNVSEEKEIVTDGTMAVGYMATSFAELDATRKIEDKLHDIQSLKSDFSMLSQNIMDNPFIEDKAAALSDLAKEFGDRITTIQETKEYEPTTEWLGEKEVWSTAFINDLPDSSFLYVAPGGKKDASGKTTPRTLRKFPYKDSTGKIDLPHLRNAIARIPQSNASGLTAEKKKSLQERARKILAKETGEKKDILETVKGWIEDLKELLLPKELPEEKQEVFSNAGIKTWVGKDGKDWIIIWSTNAFKDREQELFTTQAIEDFMLRHEKDEKKGEIWFWHMPKAKFADIKLQALVGRLFVEAGPFDDTFIGQSFKEFFQKYASGHPVLAPEGWGASHGYSYDPEDRKDGIYEWFEKKESSVLPASMAANPYNPNPSFMLNSQEDEIVDAKRRAQWNDVFGKELVDAIVETGETKTQELENAGVEYKAIETEPVEPQETEQEVEQEEVKEEAVVTETENVTADVKEELPELVVEPITREEIKAVLKELVVALREEMKEETAKQIEETVDGLNEILVPMAQKIRDLVKSEEEKIAEQVKDIPGASRQTFIDSILGNKATEVDRRTKFGRDKPEEAEDNLDGEHPSVKGVSLKLW